MSIWKNFLPEVGPNGEEEWFENELDKPTVKYLCIGTEGIEAKWLQRWYGVPYNQCVFINSSTTDDFTKYSAKRSTLILLIPLPEGSDYTQHLKELKLERILNGF